MDSTIAFLLDNWPYAIWIVIGGIIVYFYFIIKNKGENAHTRIDNLPCKAHDDLLTKFDDKLNIQNEKLNKIDVLDGKFDVLIQALRVGTTRKGEQIITFKSPIALSEYGKTLAKELSMEDYISRNWEIISKYIEANSESMNPYDIQQFCFNFVLAKTDEVLSREGYEKVKSKAFILGIAVFDLLQAAAVIIRDRFFEEHKINISEIDQYDPALDSAK